MLNILRVSPIAYQCYHQQVQQGPNIEIKIPVFENHPTKWHVYSGLFLIDSAPMY